MTEFIEIILTDEDQRNLSEKLFGNRNYSDDNLLCTDSSDDNEIEILPVFICEQCTNCNWVSGVDCTIDNKNEDLVNGICEEYNEKFKKISKKNAQFYGKDMTDIEMDLYL